MPWFREQMPLIKMLTERFAVEKPFDGLNIGVCMHIEPKTACWVECLLAGGAKHITIVGNLGTTSHIYYWITDQI